MIVDEMVELPRADVEFVVQIANRNERSEAGDRLAVLLSRLRAALSDGDAPAPEAVGCINKAEQAFASAKTHNIASLIKSGWTPVYTHPTPAPVGQLVEAARDVLASWDARMADGPEQLKPGSSIIPPYWSPHASMVDAEAMAKLRATLSGGAIGDGWLKESA